jgi:transposase InsO family protein
MPWQETKREMERMKFIVALANGEDTMTALCERFGISRQTGYKWIERFEAGGPAALEDRKPLAGVHKNQTPADIAAEVVALRKTHPNLGPKKLREKLIRAEAERAKTEGGEPERTVPAASTIGDILVRNGLVAPRKKRLRVPPSPSVLSEMTCPNAVWTADHKGCFRLANGKRCYPLTIADGYSRYLIKCEALTSTSEEAARPHFERAFREHGVPVRIRTDNGTPFAAAGSAGGLTSLSRWWVKLGIALERIEPGHPEQNGRHERMHRTLEEAIDEGTCDLAEQQRRFDVFRGYYNRERPHEGLGMRTPAEVYETSWRPFPAVLPELVYDLDMNVRRITSNGRVKWRGHDLFVSHVLAGELVGLREFDEDRWLAYFGPVLLGFIDMREAEPRLRHKVPEPAIAPASNDSGLPPLLGDG